ncbi:MAG: hypothetical protein NWR72_19060 [Bacteroidia bacterium]|nr:hypothetical protein [Bacteroidia bacterium]
MVTIIAIAVVLSLGGGMLYALSVHAQKNGESGISWSFGLLLVWAFVWIISRAGLLILGGPESQVYQRWHPWMIGGAILLCFSTFALYWYLLEYRTRDHDLEEKVKEIGEEE